MSVVLPVGCRSDSDCSPREACVNRQCENPCSYTQCGTNALCRADGNHKARCYCPDNYRGDPYVRCTSPECTKDSDCPYNLACRNERCESPCNCAPTALCTVTDHRAACKCPPGYLGNPQIECTIGECSSICSLADLESSEIYVCIRVQLPSKSPISAPKMRTAPPNWPASAASARIPASKRSPA